MHVWLFCCQRYLLAALKGHIDPAHLRFYRQGHANLPGHPELGMTPGVQFRYAQPPLRPA